MSLEKYEYPPTGTVTAFWLPAMNAVVDPWGDELDEGVVPDPSSGKQRYNYEEGIQVKIFQRLYDWMPESERTAYEVFRDAVGGDKFKFTDDAGTAHTVTFEVFTRKFQLRGHDRWSWEVLLRKEL